MLFPSDTHLSVFLSLSLFCLWPVPCWAGGMGWIPGHLYKHVLGFPQTPPHGALGPRAFIQLWPPCCPHGLLGNDSTHLCPTPTPYFRACWPCSPSQQEQGYVYTIGWDSGPSRPVCARRAPSETCSQAVDHGLVTKYRSLPPCHSHLNSAVCSV